jgi:hypothetical protein
MKKLFFIIVLTAGISLFHNTYGQRVMGVLAGGFNATHVEGDDVFGFRKLGFNAGAAAVVPFGEKWSFTLETLYSQKGSFHKEGGRGMDYRLEHDYNHYKLVLNYVEVPVLVHFKDRTGIKGGLGFAYGRLIRVKEWEDHLRMATTTLNEGPYDDNDYSMLFDVEIPVYQQLKFNARYAFSLFKIREREYLIVSPNEEKIRKQYNRVLSFRLLWYFNEEASRQSRLRAGF